MPQTIKPTPEKRCSMYGCRLLRKRYNGRLEDLAAFTKRLFCSLSCANSRTKGGLSRKAFHAQARKHMKLACESCGAVRYRHVHHINEDWTDNAPANLQTLCVFCHQFWHAMHRRLGVKPSTRMPPLLSPLPTVLTQESGDSRHTATRSSSRKPKSGSKL